MGYWTDKADSEGQQAEKMPAGFYKAKAIKVVTGKKDGSTFKSKGGDPQIMVVFANRHDQEVAPMFTLSDKAAFVLAKFLKHAGANLVKMEEAGITIDRFADKAFAEKQIVGRECWIGVEWKPNDNGKEYASVEFLGEDEVPIQWVRGMNDTAKAIEDAHVPLEEDQIPF